MTENRESSTISALMPISSGNTTGKSTGVDDFMQADSSASKDTSFSRELSRISDQSAPVKRFDDSSNRKTLDSDRSATKNDSTQRHGADAERSHVKPVEKPAESTVDPANTAEEAITDPARKTDKAVEARNTHLSDISDARIDKETVDVGKAKSLIPDDNQKHVELPTDTDVLSDGKEGVVLTGIEESMPAKSGTNKVISLEAEANDADADSATSNKGQRVDVSTGTSRDGVNALITNGTTLTKVSDSVPLTPGEQLSPVQLANRQAHLFDDAKTTSRQPIITEQPISDLPVNSKTITVNSVGDNLLSEKFSNRKSTSEATISDKAISTKTVDGELPVRAAGAVVVPAQLSPTATTSAAQTTETELYARGELKQEFESTELEIKHLRKVQIQAAADADMHRAARKAELQSVRENLAKVQQLAQQQVLNPISNQSVAETPENATVQADNMFLSLPGGIVTAPVLNRIEAGNTQIINAPVNIPLLQNDADKAMAGNVRWMVNEGVKNAVLSVTPSGMGPISVSIGIEKDQMNVSIVAQQGSTREALDLMIPRLREQLAAQGHDSVKVDISDGRSEQSNRGYGEQFPGKQPGNDQNQNNASSGVNNSDSKSSSETTTRSSALPSSNGILTVNSTERLTGRYDVYV